MAVNNEKICYFAVDKIFHNVQIKKIKSMKKIKTLAIAFLAVAAASVVSCSKSPADDMVSKIEDATAKVEKASTSEELDAITMEMFGTMMSLANDKELVEAIEKDEAAKKAIDEAGDKFEEALNAKKAELGIDVEE